LSHRDFTGHITDLQVEHCWIINRCSLAPSKNGFDASSGIGTGFW